MIIAFLSQLPSLGYDVICWMGVWLVSFR